MISLSRQVLQIDAELLAIFEEMTSFEPQRQAHIFRADLSASQKQETFDHIAQLAYLAGPRILLQGLDGG